MSGEPAQHAADLGRAFLLRHRRGDVFRCHSARSFPRTLFGAASFAGRRQSLQQLGGGAEPDVLLRLCRLGEQGQDAAAPPAGVAAQLVVARNGTVPGQNLHLAEDGFVSMTRPI